MAGVACSKCDVGWVIHSHDKHCGYCGCKVFDFSVKWKEEPLIYAGNSSDIYDLTMLIENSGAYPIIFQSVQAARENNILFPQSSDSPFEVEAGQFQAVPIQLRLANLEGAQENITVRAQNAPSGFESEKSLPLQILLTPEFQLTPNSVVVRHRKGTKQATIDLRLEVLQSRFTIKSIKFSPQWIKKAQCKRGPHEKSDIAKNVSLEIDCTRLNDRLNVAKLRFELKGFSQPIEKQVHIRREIEPEPPKLFVPPMNLDITQDREKTHTLTLQNRGERPLIIQNIVFNGPSTLVQLPNREFPINIEGEERQDIEIQISAIGIDPGMSPVDFTIDSNCEETPEYKGVLNVNVAELEAYPHYLAIDFGTTNSCCAYLGAEDVFQLIQLDSENFLMPSSIIYHSQPTNEEGYTVGYEAETRRTSEIDGPYYISSVKRWLGYNWKRQFPNNRNLQPRDVVADILRHIIQRAEEHLDTLSPRSEIRKCVITYPTMFNIKQREDIEQAFEKIGITELIFIDEASAASLGVISQREQQGDYRLLVYDFGGGTIDIVLSQVTNNDNEITIEPLAYGGNPKYGGDDVTQAIVDFVLNEFKQQIKENKENLNPRYDIPYLSSRKVWQSSGGEKKDNAMLSNTRFLYNSAEEVKKELSDKEQASRDFPLSVLVGSDIHPLEELTQGNINVNISKAQLQSLVAHELCQTFADIDTMISENDGHLPEVVILAGQSSRMPIVKEMMTAHFQQKYQTDDIDIQLSDSPKECVAKGAARYGVVQALPGTVSLEIKNFRRTRSSIGIMQSSIGQQVFKEIIPKGKIIPDESFGRTSIRLPSGEIFIDVRERFGTDDKLSRIDDYVLTLPENIPKEALKNACLKMAVEENGEIRMAALVDNREYEFTVKKTKPEFVDEI